MHMALYILFSSFELPGEEIGEEAALMLIRTIEAAKNEKPPVRHLTLSAHLEERESTS